MKVYEYDGIDRCSRYDEYNTYIIDTIDNMKRDINTMNDDIVHRDSIIQSYEEDIHSIMQYISYSDDIIHTYRRMYTTIYDEYTCILEDMHDTRCTMIEYIDSSRYIYDSMCDVYSIIQYMIDVYDRVMYDNDILSYNNSILYNHTHAYDSILHDIYTYIRTYNPIDIISLYHHHQLIDDYNILYDEYGILKDTHDTCSRDNRYNKHSGMDNSNSGMDMIYMLCTQSKIIERYI